MKYTDTTLRVAMARVLLEPCLLCTNPSDGCAVFHPHDPSLYGASNGNDRLIVYSLCSMCQARPGSPEKVEAILAARCGGES
jgi:hypothetical protein